MKKIILFILIIASISCKVNDNELQPKFKFINNYKAKIVVGGFVGTTERVFKIGEIYEGTQQQNATILIRIAAHSERNNNCPNSLCYQELLEVPERFLKQIQ